MLGEEIFAFGDYALIYQASEQLTQQT